MMQPYHDGDFDMEGMGLTEDDFDFDDANLPPLPLDRTRWQPAEHWETTEAEHYHLDLPYFASHAQRTGWFIHEMGQQALTSFGTGATQDDPVLPFNGGLVSLRELLEGIEDEGLPGIVPHR